MGNNNNLFDHVISGAISDTNKYALKLNKVNVWPEDNRVDISFFCDATVEDKDKSRLEAAFSNVLGKAKISISFSKMQKIKRETPSIEHEKDSSGVSTVKRQFGNSPTYEFVQVKTAEKTQSKSTLLMGSQIRSALSEMKEINEETGRITVQGEVLDIDIRELKSKKRLITIDITDKTSSVTVKVFERNDPIDNLVNKAKKGKYICVRGDCRYDNFSKEVVLFANDIELREMQSRTDDADEKRVELHLHTKMSNMDAVVEAKEAIKLAHSWGHRGIAITDHGVLQSFPDVHNAARKLDNFKVAYGLEAYLVDDTLPIVENCDDRELSGRFVVFDVETTGLNPAVAKLTEIGAVLLEDGMVRDKFQTFVNPGIPIPTKITNLTGITNSMVKGAPSPIEAVRKFAEFAEGACLVAHNAPFDMSFIRAAGKKEEIIFDQPVLDTVPLARQVWDNLKNHKLNTIAKYFKINMGNHHRADDDANTTAIILKYAFVELKKRNAKTLMDVNSVFSNSDSVSGLPTYHAILIAKTQEGIKNLNHLVSLSHLEYFHYKPRIPKSILAQNRKGLLVGSACEQGELFRAVLKDSDKSKIDSIAAFYDYYEIQPLGNNKFLITRGEVEGNEGLIEINKRIVELGNQNNKLVVATGDVHFINPEDGVYRDVLLNSKKMLDGDKAPLYLRTTDEMIAEFEYLGEGKAKEVVVTNTNKLLDLVEDGTTPFLFDKFYAPTIEGVDDEVRKSAYDFAKNIYGDPLPEIVEKRLEKELNSIISHGYGVLYSIAQKMVHESVNDGYLVGSRGSVGSSFAATMLGITEVNPLSPHYVCPNCKNSDFDVDTSVYGIGCDMPDKRCERCNEWMKKDGYDIPFEVFLGFKGNKIPDIDLNFSGEYQSTGHKRVEEQFGKEHVFRAGTISTIAERTAEGFARQYCEEHEIFPTRAEIKRLAKGCIGVKRTTGQHPGGVIIVPDDMNVLDFTPLQHPADAKDSGVITTHFDFNSLHDNLVKLDMLGHDDPSMLRMLQNITGIDPTTIRLDDEQTMKIFSGVEPLGIDKEDLGCEVGTLGVPEFGTRFVRQMLEDTRPKTMAELVRISGLSHGENLWIGNAKELINDGITTLSQALCTRDDIMNQLMQMGMDSLLAFNIMESVRKGKGLSNEMEQAMKNSNVPEWFIESCRRIKYMFPKAHAAAYVMMAFRIAYYKVHYPLAYYATYYSIRCDGFDASFMLGDVAHIKEMVVIYTKKAASDKKEQKTLTVLETVLEMNLRGITFLPIDVQKSDAIKFLVQENSIRPPFSSLPGVGENAAKSIQSARDEREFRSIEDLKQRARIGNSTIEILKKQDCLGGLPQSDQISLF